MNNAAKQPYRIALYGMDTRTYKTMEMYLKGPCRGIAIVVSESEAEIDMIDADHYQAKILLEARRAATPHRPIILLSLELLEIEKTFFIQKPITVKQIEVTLAKIQSKLVSTKKAPLKPPISIGQNIITRPSVNNEHPPASTANKSEKIALEVYLKKPPLPKNKISQESLKTAKHHTAMQLNEGGFTTFLGTLSDVDFDDKTQLLNSSYDQKQFFLWFVSSAYQKAVAKSLPLQLKSIWKSLYIFPDNQEIWVDADDKQLRSFAGIRLTREFVSSIQMTPLSSSVSRADLALEKFQYIDAFIWKLSIWASKGRFQLGIDLQQPLSLKRWPNFTRLVITPDALRIAALLVKAPRLPTEVVDMLNTKPQFVFVFLSACQNLGLLETSPVEQLKVAEEKPNIPTKKVKTGLFVKIINKLRGI